LEFAQGARTAHAAKDEGFWVRHFERQKSRLR
jgi:hypothetical protein